MDADFWSTAWDENRIAFHQGTANADLVAYYPQLGLSDSPTILVPLCGKSLDMLWLRGEGASVIGVEIVPKAVEAFFSENDLPFQRVVGDNFERYTTDGIEILCGSVFDVDAEQAQRADAVYDRAALIAFPPEMRQEYVGLLNNVLREDAVILLVTMEYEGEGMFGPPFSVTDSEVRRLYGDRFNVTLEKETDVLSRSERFRERGATRLIERVYTMRPN